MWGGGCVPHCDYIIFFLYLRMKEEEEAKQEALTRFVIGLQYSVN